MRALIIGTTAAALGMAIGAALAAGRLSPGEIQSTFFNGQPFTSSAGSTKYKMIFSSDGKMIREPVGKSGKKSEGIWKLSKDGYCTTWKEHSRKCFVVATAGKNKWSVMRGRVLTATWTK